MWHVARPVFSPVYSEQEVLLYFLAKFNYNFTYTHTQTHAHSARTRTICHFGRTCPQICVRAFRLCRRAVMRHVPHAHQALLY